MTEHVLYVRKRGDKVVRPVRDGKWFAMLKANDDGLEDLRDERNIFRQQGYEVQLLRADEPAPED